MLSRSASGLEILSELWRKSYGHSSNDSDPRSSGDG